MRPPRARRATPPRGSPTWWWRSPWRLRCRWWGHEVLYIDGTDSERDVVVQEPREPGPSPVRLRQGAERLRTRARQDPGWVGPPGSAAPVRPPARGAGRSGPA